MPGKTLQQETDELARKPYFARFIIMFNMTYAARALFIRQKKEGSFAEAAANDIGMMACEISSTRLGSFVTKADVQEAFRQYTEEGRRG